MISTNGGTPQPLERTNASNTNYDLAWWPSDEVVYQKSGNRNYLRVNDKTQTEESIIQNDESKGWVPSKPIFSPDGKRLAVDWNRRGTREGLWIVSLQPYSETLVQPQMMPFGWSPDGKQVYAVRGIESQPEIVAIRIATPNDVVSIATLPGDIASFECVGCRGLPSLSPDGRQIIASLAEEKSDVWLMENFDPSLRSTKPQP